MWKGQKVRPVPPLQRPDHVRRGNDWKRGLPKRDGVTVPWDIARDLKERLGIPVEDGIQMIRYLVCVLMEELALNDEITIQDFARLRVHKTLPTMITGWDGNQKMSRHGWRIAVSPRGKLKEALREVDPGDEKVDPGDEEP